MVIKYTTNELFYSGKQRVDFSPATPLTEVGSFLSAGLPRFSVATREGWISGAAQDDLNRIPEIPPNKCFVIVPDSAADGWVDIVVSQLTIALIELALTNVLRQRVYDREVTVKLDKPKLLYQLSARSHSTRMDMVELQAPLNLASIVVGRPVYFLRQRWYYPTLGPCADYIVCPESEGVSEVRVVCGEIEKARLARITEFVALTSPGVPQDADITIDYMGQW